MKEKPTFFEIPWARRPLAQLVAPRRRQQPLRTNSEIPSGFLERPDGGWAVFFLGSPQTWREHQGKPISIYGEHPISINLSIYQSINLSINLYLSIYLSIICGVGKKQTVPWKNEEIDMSTNIHWLLQISPNLQAEGSHDSNLGLEISGAITE